MDVRLIFIAGYISVVHASCSDGWVEGLSAGHYMCTSNYTMTYNEAQKHCQSLGGTVLFILPQMESFMEDTLFRGNMAIEDYWLRYLDVNVDNLPENEPWQPWHGLLEILWEVLSHNKYDCWGYGSSSRCDDELKVICHKDICQPGWANFRDICVKVFNKNNNQTTYNGALQRCQQPHQKDGRLLQLDTSVFPSCYASGSARWWYRDTALWINEPITDNGCLALVVRSDNHGYVQICTDGHMSCDETLGYVCETHPPSTSTTPPTTIPTTTTATTTTATTAATRTTTTSTGTPSPSNSPGSTSTSSITSSTNPSVSSIDDDDDSGLSTIPSDDAFMNSKPTKSNLGLPVGLAVGGIVLVAVVALVVVLIIRKQRKSPASQPELPMSENIAAGNTALQENHIYTSLSRDQEGNLM